MTKSKQTKLLGIGCIALALVVAIFGIVYLLNSAKAEAGSKIIMVTVVHKDETSKDFTITTEAESLADALLQDEIVEGSNGDYGLYITTADGEAADENNQEWWCLTKNGETMTTGATDTMISDGDKYEITFTVGW